MALMRTPERELSSRGKFMEIDPSCQFVAMKVTFPK